MEFEYGHTYTAYNAYNRDISRKVTLVEPLKTEWSDYFWIAEDEDGNYIIVSEEWLR